MMRADVDSCGSVCDWGSDLESLSVFTRIGAAVGVDGEVDSAPSA